MVLLKRTRESNCVNCWTCRTTQFSIVYLPEDITEWQREAVLHCLLFINLNTTYLNTTYVLNVYISGSPLWLCFRITWGALQKVLRPVPHTGSIKPESLGYKTVQRSFYKAAEWVHVLWGQKATPRMCGGRSWIVQGVPQQGAWRKVQISPSKVLVFTLFISFLLGWK